MRYEWISLFTNTGSEIYAISKELGYFPDKIITNKPLKDLAKVHSLLVAEFPGIWIFLPRIPTADNYLDAIGDCAPLVTLHGYMRIIPPVVCSQHLIYNGHPGLIDPALTATPDFLKGKDPQLKAFNAHLQESGCVIHRVTGEVDNGRIVSSRKVNIEGMGLDAVYSILKQTSFKLWVEFLNNTNRYR